MSRTILEPETLQEVSGFVVSEPTRFIFKSPRLGGPTVSELHIVLGSKGKLRLSGTAARLFADLDPGAPDADAPLVALDMIARSDARGLERAVLSALPHVDEIIIGVDERSDAETRKMAELYADEVHGFHGCEIGLTDEEWAADKIHFANARNLGRSVIRAPFTLVIDTDEYLAAGDVRAAAREALRQTRDAIDITVQLDADSYIDCQRLARTGLRWNSASHNQLGPITSTIAHHEVRIIGDTSLRSKTELARREAQRNRGIEELREAADGGDLVALFHVVKHLLAFDAPIPEVQPLVERYRSFLEPHGPATNERAWVALALAFRYYMIDDLTQAEVWAQRALLDGPRVEAFCLLGDVAEDRGDLRTALTWYEIACVTPDTKDFRIEGAHQVRWGRRAALRQAMGASS